LESIDHALIIASNPRLEQPMINHRLRKASLSGASIDVVNVMAFDFMVLFVFYVFLFFIATELLLVIVNSCLERHLPHGLLLVIVNSCLERHLPHGLLLVIVNTKTNNITKTNINIKSKYKHKRQI
jgi:hypothetical protein